MTRLHLAILAGIAAPAVKGDIRYICFPSNALRAEKPTEH